MSDCLQNRTPRTPRCQADRAIWGRHTHFTVSCIKMASCSLSVSGRGTGDRPEWHSLEAFSAEGAAVNSQGREPLVAMAHDQGLAPAGRQNPAHAGLFLSPRLGLRSVPFTCLPRLTPWAIDCRPLVWSVPRQVGGHHMDLCMRPAVAFALRSERGFGPGFLGSSTRFINLSNRSMKPGDPSGRGGLCHVNMPPPQQRHAKADHVWYPQTLRVGSAVEAMGNSASRSRSAAPRRGYRFTRMT